MLSKKLRYISDDVCCYVYFMVWLNFKHMLSIYLIVKSVNYYLQYFMDEMCICMDVLRRKDDWISILVIYHMNFNHNDLLLRH